MQGRTQGGAQGAVGPKAPWKSSSLHNCSSKKIKAYKVKKYKFTMMNKVKVYYDEQG